MLIIFWLFSSSFEARNGLYGDFLLVKCYILKKYFINKLPGQLIYISQSDECSPMSAVVSQISTIGENWEITHGVESVEIKQIFFK